MWTSLHRGKMCMNWSDSALPIFTALEILRMPALAGIMLEVATV